MASLPTTSDHVGTLLRKIARNTKEIADNAITPEQIALINSAVQPDDLGNSALLDVGTTEGTVAAGNHTHNGIFATFAQGALADTDTNICVLLEFDIHYYSEKLGTSWES